MFRRLSAGYRCSKLSPERTILSTERILFVRSRWIQVSVGGIAELDMRLENITGNTRLVYNGDLKNTINCIPTYMAVQYTWFTLKIVFILMSMTIVIRAKNLLCSRGSTHNVIGTLIFQSVRFRRT